MDHYLKTSLSYAYTTASVETSLTQNGNPFDGEDIDVGTSSLRGDVRFYPGGVGNVGNVANVGNIGNIANIANFALFGLSNCYVGVQGAVGLGGGDTGLKLDLHGVGGVVDTTLRLRNRGSVTPYVGCTVARFPNQMGYLNLHGGPRFQFLKWTFETDESQQGGDFERVDRSETDVGAAFGLEYNLPLDPEYYGGLQGGLQFGAWATRMPGMDFSTTTPTFNIDYGIKTDSYWAYTIRAGGYLNF